MDESQQQEKPAQRDGKAIEVASGVVAGTTQAVVFSMTVLKRLAIGLWGNPIKIFKPVRMEPLHFAMVHSKQKGESNKLHAIKSSMQYGVLGFARTVLPPIAANAIIGSVVFTLYAKIVASRRDTEGRRVSIHEHIGAGFLAGIPASVLSTPLESIKIVSSAKIYQRELQDVGFFQTTQDIIRANGIRGLYHGFTISMLRDCIGYAAFFGTFITCLQHLTDHFSGFFPGEKACHVVVSGALAGWTYYLFNYPVENFKEKMMTDNLTIPQTWRAVRDSEEGFWSLFKGFRKSARRVLPASGLAFLLFQLVNHRFRLSDDLLL